MSALFGVLGVVAGVMISGAVGFWSTRRQELENAVVAAALLVDELTLDPGGPTNLDQLWALWEQQRAALVLYLPSEQFSKLNRTIRKVTAVGSPTDVHAEVSKVLPGLQRQALKLRADHQAFILTPLIKYLFSKPWRPRDPGATQLRG
jgi:hypothetical protein